eukprot:8280501-Alexandrium_andersonii.AAC.1
MSASLVGSEMCIRDRGPWHRPPASTCCAASDGPSSKERCAPRRAGSLGRSRGRGACRPP